MSGFRMSPGAREPETLSTRVLLRDGFPRPLSTVAGFAVAIDGDIACATGILLVIADLSVAESHVVSLPAQGPGETGQQLPAGMAALVTVFRELSKVPDVALIRDHGIAHPQRCGVASRFGVATGIPTIGVAATPLVGSSSPLHQVSGAYTPLREQGEQIGWLLRTQAQEEPLVVSPGHKVAMASAADLVMRCVTRDRWPEPLRLAEQLLSGGVDSADAESE